MEHSLILRELKREDLPALQDVIRKTWNYDKFATPKTARKLAKVYLASCLTNQTYTQVAEVDGIPVGLILGKNKEKHHCLGKYRLRQISALCSLFTTKEGRNILSFYKHVDDIDRQLLKQCDKNYKGEIALFALSPEYRGLGIGKKLFHSLLAYMKRESIAEFYLYTDTSCNFGFYEHQGMVRQQQYKRPVEINGQKAELEFYLYDMAV